MVWVFTVWKKASKLSPTNPLVDQSYICNQKWCYRLLYQILIRKTHAHKTCIWKEKPTTAVFWLLTYSSHSHILAGNSRGEFGFGSIGQLHIPFRLFLNPLDTLQIPSNFYTQRLPARVGWSKVLFQGSERGTVLCGQRISAVLRGIKHLVH